MNIKGRKKETCVSKYGVGFKSNVQCLQHNTLTLCQSVCILCEC